MATITVGASGCDYTTIQEAINAASATEATTIVISAGTYNEDIKLDAANQKGDLTFVAAEGEEVIFAGYFDIGYRNQGVGAAKWNAAVVFENIIFDQAVAAKHSLCVQEVKSFVMNNCKVIGDGEFGINTPRGNGTEHAELNNCTFVNAGIQSLGNFSSNLTIDGCTFDNSCLNVQAGANPGPTIKNTTFNKTLTDANIGDSFYCIRSNDCPIFIEGTTFNIDSELTEVAEDQAKWGVFWQRNAGTTKWTVADIEVNFTDAAMAQTELLFNKNGTTNAANEAGRITISGITGNRKVEDILEKSEGIVNSIADGKYYIYDDGMQMSKTDLSTIYVDSNYTSDNVGTDKVFGVNAFADINAATKIASAAGSKLVIAEGTVANANKLWMNNDVYDKGTEGYDHVLDADKTFDVEVNGTLIGTQVIVNSAKMDVAATGKVFTSGDDKNFRVLNSEVTFQGSRTAGDIIANDEVFTKGFWGGLFSETEYNDKIQGTAGLMKIDAGSTVKFNDTFFLIDCGRLEIGQYWSMAGTERAASAVILDNTQLLFGNRGSYGDSSIVIDNNSTFSVTNGSYVAIAQDAKLGITINTGSEMNISGSILSADTVTNNGTITVSGESTLEIGNLTGEIQVSAGTSLTDTAIAGDDGTTIFAGTVNFYGENSITTGVNGSPFDLVVNENASLLISRFVLGYDRKITVNGVIEDATALESLDDVTLSLKANSDSGFSVGGTGTGILDVDNAYVELGSSSWKNAQGTYTWTFDNSYVKATSFGNNNPPGSDTANWTATFTDSVLDAKTYIKTGKGVTYEFTQGSKATTGSIRIDGELKVMSDSEVIVTGYQNNKVGSQDEHGDVTGKITVDGGKLDISSNASTTVELLGGEISVQNGGKLLLNNNSIALYDGAAVNLTGSESLIEAKAITGNGTINVNGGTLSAAAVTNNDTFTVSGASTINGGVDGDVVNAAQFSGSGWVYVKNATLDANTNIKDANIRFVEGESVIDGATINPTGNYFQVGAGHYITDPDNPNKEAELDRENDVTVIVKNNAYIDGGSAEGYGTWVGTEYYANNNDAKVANMTEARYTLDIQNSLAVFDTIHVSNDGILKVTGRSERVIKNEHTVWNGEKQDVNFYTGTVANYNGLVILDNTNAWSVAGVNISGDNTSTGDAAGRLIIQNKAVYRFHQDGDSNVTSLNIKNYGSVTVNNSLLEMEDGTISIADDAVLNVEDSANVYAAKGVKNDGTITIDGTSQLKANSYTGTGTITIDAADFSGYKKVIDLNGTESLKDKVTFINKADDVTAIYGADGDVTLTDADMSTIYVDASYTGETGKYLGDGKYLGVNAFADINAANKVAVTNNSTVVIAEGAEYKTRVFDNIADHTVDYWGPVSPVENVTTVQIDGSVEASTAAVINNKKATVSSTGSLKGVEHVTVTGENGELLVAGEVTTNNLRTALGASITVSGKAFLNGVTVGETYWGTSAKKSVITFDGAEVEYSGQGGGDINPLQFDVKSGNALNIINESTVESSADRYELTVNVEENAAFNVESGSSVTAENINNSGNVKVDGATLSVAGTVTNNGDFTVAGTEGNSAAFTADSITNTGTFTANNATINAETFTHNGKVAEFNNVDLDVTNFVNNTKDAGYYAVIGGTSKVQIDNLSGDRLHFADGTVLKDGSSIKGTTSTRSLGDITFGETENDVIHVDSFANNGTSAYEGTITVNGTLTISEDVESKLSSTYWLGIHGSESGTILTSDSAGVINSYGCWNIFQYGKIKLEESLTINIMDAYARDLRFTLTNMTIEGQIHSYGTNNKLNAVQSSNLTITGENAALTVDSYLLVGYNTYKGSNDDSVNYKSSIVVEDGANMEVGGRVYLNLSSTITVTDATFIADSVQFAGNEFNMNRGVFTVGGTSTVVVDEFYGNMTFGANAVLSNDSKINFTGAADTVTVKEGGLTFQYGDMTGVETWDFAEGSKVAINDFDWTGTVLNGATNIANTTTTLVINGSSVLWNEDKTAGTVLNTENDNKIYDVTVNADSITVAESATPDEKYEDLTLTLNSITQGDGYNFTVDATADKGKPGYTWSVAVKDLATGETKTYDSLTFELANTISKADVTVTVTDAYGMQVSELKQLVVKDVTAPTLGEITADVTSITNGNVIVSIAECKDNFGVKKVEYSIDGGVTWVEGNSVEVSINDTKVQFRATDAAGNVSAISEYTVTNIDKVAPDAPVASADETNATNGNVTVSAAFSTDSVKKEYSLDGKTWNAYTEGVVFEDNGSIWFKGTDAVGNVSAISEYTVTNIDKVAPDAPVASADEINATNGNVTVSAAFSADSVKKEYSLDGKTWNAYTEGVVFKDNGSIQFKATDAAGNESVSDVFEVNNIDKVAPDAPVASADEINATNGNVTVSAAFSADSVKKEYSLDGKTWNAYTEGVVFEDNGSIRFKGTDAAGNVSEISEYTVSNIDKVAPEFTDAKFELAGDKVVASWSVADSGSGIAKVLLFVDGKEVADVTGKTAYEFESGVFGEFKLTAFDVAGNEVSSSKLIDLGGSGSGDTEAEPEPVKKLNITAKTPDEEINDLADSYVIMAAGKSDIKIQSGSAKEPSKVTVQGFGKEAGEKTANDINNITVGNNTSLDVHDNIANLGNVKVGNNASLQVLISNQDETLAGIDKKQTIKVGKNSEFVVHGNLELGKGNNQIKIGQNSVLAADSIVLGEGNNKINIGKNAVAKTEKDITLKDGKNQIKIGNDATFQAGNINYGTGNAKLTIGKDADVTTGNINLGEGKNQIKIGNEADVTAGNITAGSANDKLTVGKDADVWFAEIDLGAGNDTFNIGADSDVHTGNILTGAGNDKLVIGKDAYLHAEDLKIDMGEGKDTLNIKKNGQLFVDSLAGIETIKAAKGAELHITSQINFDGINGSWKNLEIFHELDDIDGFKYGVLYGNETDLISFDEAQTASFSLDGEDLTGLNVEFSNDGVIWQDLAIGTEVTFKQLRVSVEGLKADEKKEYSLTKATLA